MVVKSYLFYAVLHPIRYPSDNQNGMFRRELIKPMHWGYILCIDDDAAELNTIANQLQEEFSRSHIVYKAVSAEEATLVMDMLQAAQKRIELIICDHNMPGLKGAEFLDKMHRTFPDVMKLLLVESNDGMSSSYLLSRATIHNVIEKPWRKEQLILTVENLLKLFRIFNHLEELQQISFHFGAIFDLPQLLRKAIHLIQEMTAAWRVSIAVTDGKTSHVNLYISSAANQTADQQAAEKIEAFLRAVFSKRKEPVIFSNADENEYLQQYEIPDWHHANHMVCIPLWRGNNFYGAIYMADKLSGLPFFKEDIISAQIIAYQLISSLESLGLTEEKLRMDRLSTIGNMAGEIIHDLKGPMTSILGFAELLEDDTCSSEEKKEFSRIIVSEVEQMVEMVEEILEFSRGDRMKLNLQPCDVEDLIAEIVEVLGRHFSDHSIQIVTKLRCKERIYADKEKLKRVFFNIANNAKDAIQGQGHGKFSINTYSHHNTHIEFRLADSGVGIPPHVRENIFEPFVTYGKKRGTGLGMSITKKIIEDHGGKIWLVSEEGKGTIFYFTVPFAKSSS